MTSAFCAVAGAAAETATTLAASHRYDIMASSTSVGILWPMLAVTGHAVADFWGQARAKLADLCNRLLGDHQVVGHLSGEHGRNAVKRKEAHCVARGHRRTAEMRKEHDILQREIARVQLWLALENVEPREADLPAP